MKASIPSQEVLKTLLDYDPETGQLSWKPRPREFFTSDRAAKSWKTQRENKPALATVCNGYKVGTLLGKTYWAHRVIWKWMTGEEPQVIDHIDQNPSNNRWSNLRSTDTRGNAQNQRLPKNNSSGVIGVRWDPQNKRWKAGIAQKHLGSFRNFEDAVRARKLAEQQLGFHPNHGQHLSDGG